MKNNPKVSICIPTYNAQDIILPTLKNIIAQNYPNLEIIISDDCSTDDTISVIKSQNIKNIKIHRNSKNIGYAHNLNNFPKLASGEIIFLMGQDDFIINNGLWKTIYEFQNNPKVSIVTRPYYWFTNDIRKPIRHIPPPNTVKNTLIDITQKPDQIIPLIESIGQLSGLAYKKQYLLSFNTEIFTAHVQPFLKIATKHKCVFLKDYTIAVQIKYSQTRFKSSIYNRSPILTWVEMIERTIPKNKFPKLYSLAKKHVAKNYVGLIQIKNYSTFFNLIREIYYLTKIRPLNLISPLFYFYSITTILIPIKLLRWLTDYYKEKIISRHLPRIPIKISNSLLPIS
jgi:glycosyltransferase involved in cell wall biosynthesis